MSVNTHPPEEIASLSIETRLVLRHFRITEATPNNARTMQHTNCRNLGITLAGVLALIGASAKADTFGSGANTFTIDFVNIGNAGNGNDLGAGGGFYSSPYGGVGYDYRMGTTEVAQDWISKATNLGLTNVTAGPWTGNRPATDMEWYQAASFVNWLNTSTGHQPAYNLTFTEIPDLGLRFWTMLLWSSAEAWQADGENRFRHKDAFYFLPSEDEWYKSAYHKNDGVTANYWDYATGSNTIPIPVGSGTGAGTAVYGQPFAQGPADVANSGGPSPYGTRGQSGNAFELLESAADGTNDIVGENRVLRSGHWSNSEVQLRSTLRIAYNSAGDNVGYRIASASQPVPEPSTGVLLLASGCMWLLTRRRRRER